MQEGEDHLGMTVGQIDGLAPLSESICTVKEETVPSWRGKETEEVDVDVVETGIWDIEGANRRFVLVMHFVVQSSNRKQLVSGHYIQNVP